MVSHLLYLIQCLFLIERLWNFESRVKVIKCPELSIKAEQLNRDLERDIRVRDKECESMLYVSLFFHS